MVEGGNTQFQVGYMSYPVLNQKKSSEEQYDLFLEWHLKNYNVSHENVFEGIEHSCSLNYGVL